MSKDKFFHIQKFFHLANNEYDDCESLYKVRIIFEIIKFWKKFYYPYKQLAIDETIIPFYCRVKFSVYNPMKPEKWGFKVYSFCDAINNYCLDFRMYSGKKFIEIYKNELSCCNFRFAIVFALLQKDFYHKNHSLYIDNFYNSISLVKNILDKKVYVTVTCNFTKKEKQEIKNLLSKNEEEAKYVQFESKKNHLEEL